MNTYLLCHPHSSSNLNSKTQLDVGTEGLQGSSGSYHVVLPCPKDVGQNSGRNSYTPECVRGFCPHLRRIKTRGQMGQGLP